MAKKSFLETNGCCRKLCTLCNCGSGCADASTGSGKALTGLSLVLLVAAIACNIVGALGMSSSESHIQNVPWGTMTFNAPIVEGVTFTSFEGQWNINIWGACISFAIDATTDGGSYVTEVSEACNSWGEMTDAIEAGTVPDGWDCTTNSFACDMFTSQSQSSTLRTQAAYTTCKDAVSGLMVTVAIAVLTSVFKAYKGFTNMRLACSRPDSHALRNKCTTLVTFILPVILQGSAMAEYMRGCVGGLSELESSYGSATVFEEVRVGAGGVAFIISLFLTLCLAGIELCTPSKWPGEPPADTSSTTAASHAMGGSPAKPTLTGDEKL